LSRACSTAVCNKILLQATVEQALDNLIDNLIKILLQAAVEQVLDNLIDNLVKSYYRPL
jgi:hypothetical protein